MQVFCAFLIIFLLSPAVYSAINKIERGPYLQKPSPDSMTIRWRTKKPSISLIEIYRNDSKGIVQDLVKEKDHKITLSGLKPSTEYFYSILADKKDKRNVIENKSGESIFSFKTFPSDELSAATVLILGDPGIMSDDSIEKKFKKKQVKVIEGVEKFRKKNKLCNFDFILTLGDNAYHNGKDKEFQKGFFEPYEGLLSQVPLLTCFGNHDSGLNRKHLSYIARSYPSPRGVYYDIFSLPGKKAYYSFDFSNSHFIVLDSFDSIWEDLKEDYSNYEEIWDDESEVKNSMLEWLKNDLENNLKTWNIVVFHHPPFTEESDYEKQDIWRAWVNSFIVPLIEEYKIDLVLSGHIHNYQRSFLVKSEKTKIEKEFTKVKEVKESKKVFFDYYLEKKRNLVLNNYVPKLINKDKDQYKKGEGLIYTILGSSGAAFKELEDNALPIFATRLQKAGAVILNIDSDSLEYNFVGVDGKALDHFTITK